MLLVSQKQNPYRSNLVVKVTNWAFQENDLAHHLALIYKKTYISEFMRKMRGSDCVNVSVSPLQLTAIAHVHSPKAHIGGNG